MAVPSTDPPLPVSAPVPTCEVGEWSAWSSCQWYPNVSGIYRYRTRTSLACVDESDEELCTCETCAQDGNWQVRTVVCMIEEGSCTQQLSIHYASFCTAEYANQTKPWTQFSCAAGPATMYSPVWCDAKCSDIAADGATGNVTYVDVPDDPVVILPNPPSYTIACPEGMGKLDGLCVVCENAPHPDPCLRYVLVNGTCTDASRCGPGSLCGGGECEYGICVGTPLWYTCTPPTCNATIGAWSEPPCEIPVPEIVYHGPIGGIDPSDYFGCDWSQWDATLGFCVAPPGAPHEDPIQVVGCLGGTPAPYTNDCTDSKTSCVTGPIPGEIACDPTDPCSLRYCDSVSGQCAISSIGWSSQCQMRTCSPAGYPAVHNDNNYCRTHYSPFVGYEVFCDPVACPHTPSGCRLCSRVVGMGTVIVLDDCECLE